VVKRAPPRLRRYQGGGSVESSTIDPNYMSKLINQGFDTTKGVIGMANAAKSLMKGGGGSDMTPKTADTTLTGGAGPGNPTAGARKGGPIRKTFGPKLGREDGVIAAQKGEYVIKKAAAKKLGRGVLDTINKGKLPQKGKAGR
jgi:hypothetical protein